MDRPTQKGQVTDMLPRHFFNVLGTDPSEGMIAEARRQAERGYSDSPAGTVTFKVCAAEEVSRLVKPGVVDLVTAGDYVYA